MRLLGRRALPYLRQVTRPISFYFIFRRGKSNESFENSAETPTEVWANRASFLNAPLRIRQVGVFKRRFDRALFLVIMTMPLRLALRRYLFFYICE